jgi:protein Hikeshi
MAETASQQPLFGLLPAGHPLVTAPSSQPEPTSFLYAIPSATPANPKPFSHIAVFLLPGVSLPDNAAAAIYVATNPGAIAAETEPPNFRFLGGIGPGKESAVFKLTGGGEGVVIGISIEEGGSVATRVEELQRAQITTSGDLVKAGSGPVAQPTTLVLAQRIIKNAFNFLASFSGQAGHVEVVPLKAFEDWWKKFESRVRSDPSFLERDQD